MAVVPAEFRSKENFTVGDEWLDSGSEPSPSGAQALLDEAAVRFDFSEYDDIDNMVDVNGGWGPFASNQFTDVTPEFTATGLRFNSTGPSPFARLRLDVSGPLNFGADGMTVVQVVELDGVIDDTRVASFDMLFDDDAPELWNFVKVRTSGGTYDALSVSLTDVAPDYHNLVTDDSADIGHLTALDATGTVVSITVLDVDAAEIRVRRVMPGYDYETTLPFDFVAEFPATEPNVDTLRLIVLPDHGTQAEDVYWNRALSSAEVDALVAHFTA